MKLSLERFELNYVEVHKLDMVVKFFSLNVIYMHLSDQSNQLLKSCVTKFTCLQGLTHLNIKKKFVFLVEFLTT